VLLILFMASQAPFSMLHRNGIRNEWTNLARSILWFWASLMMPLCNTLETALIAGLDHSENQWKSLLARPVPHWTLYVAKLIVIVAMTAASTLALLCGILMAGAILPRLQPQCGFALYRTSTHTSKQKLKGVFPISRDSGQLGPTEGVPQRRAAHVVSHALE